jgi:hypothetical protein
MFDVFYIGKKPNLFPHERSADSIQHAIEQSRTRFCWIVNYLCDYTGFDFLWQPYPWEANQRHIWSSVWQKDSGTYLVPKDGYQDNNYHDGKLSMHVDMDLWKNTNSIETFDFSWHPDYTDPIFNYEFGTQWQKTGGPVYPMPGAIETKYVSQSGTSSKAIANCAYIIDHLDGNAQTMSEQFPIPVAKIARYFDNYKDTLTRLAKSIPEDQEFVWIVSSICDYKDFDFTWHPEAWQNYMLHVFPSNEEKFGDTFFMHVPTFRSKIAEFDLLDWYDLNFVTTMRVPRKPMPVIRHKEDSQVEEVKTRTWSGPLALFTTQEHVTDVSVTVSLWREKTKTIVPLNNGASSVIVPKSAILHIKTQLYDYPYVDRTHRELNEKPLDIVFISNGEHGAEHHWQLLNESVPTQQNRIHRIDGVNGRVAAYQAAANLSETPWFFAVFAKLQVNINFDWTWQPDRMQQSKHYIFHAFNPVNHLIYGHQAMIAYNKKMTLINTGPGLDFTLDQPHEVVPIVSGIACYDIDPWMTWRTAFRETLKLQHSLPDVENEYRLKQWLDVGHGVNGRWSTVGANDAVNYYQQVNGEFAELKKSYEWAWLASYAMILHPELFTQSKT